MSDLEQLRADCLLAEKFWGRSMAGLTAITYREKGEAAFLDTWFQTLRSHQNVHYLNGLKKLGIGENESPAVKACKYHYLTNQMGGLKMEYIEESPKKCWIRYLAPMWTYSGIAMLAMPAHTRRTMSRAWHPRNGELMGCDRLQYVRTKTIMEGDPYDEGYWIEHDRPLAPEETLLFKTEIRTPEFDPAKAPKLDPEIWPEERLYKARPKFGGGYLSRMTTVLLAKFGLDSTSYIMGQTMRCLAIQYIHELKDDQGIEGSDVQSVADIFAGILRACRQDFTVERISPTRTRIVLRNYKPFDWELPEKIRDSLFEFQRMGARVLNGRLRVTRSVEPEFGPVASEAWDFEDTGRWLW
ncbi:hypothetical protein [Oceanibacterium hippocampi]|uniref:Uncharacterized protein n=1 Tax=Oceanibacterium hippocampi TaxID=745714 RepID=A0A1Y5TZ87_9PROT|nr:hypothetical protein [Oceanibacterium hippocampi]SLN71868.1 hypothetical protein OCH7691_03408 [Oceanibacterium hippocampi]